VVRNRRSGKTTFRLFLSAQGIVKKSKLKLAVPKTGKSVVVRNRRFGKTTFRLFLQFPLIKNKYAQVCLLIHNKP